MHERAVAVMPGGTTRTTTYFDPYPLYIERGQGCRVWDADGTERIDMLGNYTAMILGHAHPKVVEAIQKQASRGTGFAAGQPGRGAAGHPPVRAGAEPRRGEVLQLRHRGDDVRHATRPRVHGQAEDRADGGRLPRHPRLRRGQHPPRALRSR